MEGSPDPETLREDMLDGVAHALGRDPSPTVRNAMARVPRHEFVADAPYSNRTGEQSGTRVLSPASVARLLDALQATQDSDTLIVGAGIGYTAAVLAEIAGGRRVHAIDINRGMVQEARQNLAAAGYDAVLVDRGDGAEGLPIYAPFDRILIEAAAVAPPGPLLEQLTPEGRLVLPQGTGPKQTIVAFEPGDPPTTHDPVDTFGPIGLPPLLVEGEQADAPIRNRSVREEVKQFDESPPDPGWEHEWIDWDDRLTGTDR